MRKHLGEADEDEMDQRIRVRVAQLQAKKRLTKAEAEELAILTYDGPTPRRVAPSIEDPF
jgi:hypothetical protein